MFVQFKSKGMLLSMEFIHLLLLIMVANGAPILLQYLLREVLETPIDFGHALGNGQRLLGRSKTWRGLFSALVLTSAAAFLLGYSFMVGFWIGLLAMLGDLVSSFIKRRMGLASGEMALFLDQVPESLLPALMLKQQFGLDLMAVLILTVCFLVLELILSRVLFKLGIRDRPY